MDEKIDKFIHFLFMQYPNLKDIIKTFKWCSRYEDGKKYLVSDEHLTIDFDKFTEWMYHPPVKSADTLSFNKDYLIFIEFKSGDQTKHPNKLSKLIEGVQGKINDSDDTMTMLYKQCFSESNDRLKQKFFLVVDSKEMGINPLITTLVGLSQRNNPNPNPKERILLEQVTPDLKQNIKNKDHYETVGIWYSEIFSQYIAAEKILPLDTVILSNGE